MPSSLERFLSRALVHLHPPTCVGLRYGRSGHDDGLFLAGLLVLRFGRSLGSVFQSPRHFTFRVTRRLIPGRCRNVDLLCIGYALRPHLSSRLTLGDEPGPGNLGFTATGILIRFIATRVCILTSRRSSSPFGWPSQHRLRSPTKAAPRTGRPFQASVDGLIANHFRRDITR